MNNMILFMKQVDFTAGSLGSPVRAYILENLSSVCKSHESHPGIIILPGGGYNHISPREGEPVALRFADAAYNSFVLSYPVGEDIKKEKPIETVRQLVRHIAENHERYNTDPHRLAVIGFSAGAHLAASYGTICKGEGLKAMILGYPVISSGPYAHNGSFDMLCQSEEERAFYSLEHRADSSTLPSFIFHSADDKVVPVENSLLFASALSRAGVDFELHVFSSAVHGTSLGTEDTGYLNERFASWAGSAVSWLNGKLGYTT